MFFKGGFIFLIGISLHSLKEIAADSLASEQPLPASILAIKKPVLDSAQIKSRNEAISVLNLFEQYAPFGFNKFLNAQYKEKSTGILDLTKSYFFGEHPNISPEQIDSEFLQQKKSALFKKWQSSLHKTVISAQNTLYEFAKQGDLEAEFYLAQMEMYGTGGFPLNLRSSFNRWSNIAQIHGNSTAQFNVAIFYASGLGGIDRNPAMVNMYLKMAADQNNSLAMLMLSHRKDYGIETVAKCEDAVSLLSKLADKSIDYYYKDSSLGRPYSKSKINYSLLNGGIYGIKTSPYGAVKPPQTKKEVLSIIDFYEFKVGKGDLESCLSLYRIYRDGHLYIKKDVKKAKSYLERAKVMAFIDGSIKLRASYEKKDRSVIFLTQYLAEEYLGGGVLEKDFGEASKWVHVCINLENPRCHYIYGVMHLDGLGVQQNTAEAIANFKLARDKYDSDGALNYALSLSSVDPKATNEILIETMKAGNPRGFYYYSVLNNHGQLSKNLCTTFLSYFKHFIHISDWEYSIFPFAEKAMEYNALESAAVAYIIGAELGYKVGITNAAYLLEKYQKRMSQIEYSSALDVLEVNSYLNLTAAYWIRAANMYVPDARLKQGDLYYHGKGVKEDKTKALAAYMLSADTEKNSMAMWNLGYMYEFGIGVKRDFHLAKRWYDNSALNFKHGILASTLSIARLAINYYTAVLFGEDVGKGPLFMAPTPKSNTKSLEDDSDKESEYALFKDKEYAANANFNGDVGLEKEKESTGLKEKSFLSDFHIIAALCLLLGYLVIIRRRRPPLEENPQPLNPPQPPRPVAHQRPQNQENTPTPRAQQ